jgi:hypothetical protein
MGFRERTDINATPAGEGEIYVLTGLATALDGRNGYSAPESWGQVELFPVGGRKPLGLLRAALTRRSADSRGRQCPNPDNPDGREQVRHDAVAGSALSKKGLSFGRFNAEASGAFLALPGLIHGRIGSLDVTTEPIGVEQRVVQPVMLKLAPHRFEQCTIGGEPKG